MMRFCTQCRYYTIKTQTVVLARTMKHVVTIDRRAPLAFDRIPLSIALEGVRGPRTPFSPERTVVPLPDTNPEEEESLAGALERQGASSSSSSSSSSSV